MTSEKKSSGTPRKSFFRGNTSTNLSKIVWGSKRAPSSPESNLIQTSRPNQRGSKRKNKLKMVPSLPVNVKSLRFENIDPVFDRTYLSHFTSWDDLLAAFHQTVKEMDSHHLQCLPPPPPPPPPPLSFKAVPFCISPPPFLNFEFPFDSRSDTSSRDVCKEDILFFSRESRLPQIGSSTEPVSPASTLLPATTVTSAPSLTMSGLSSSTVTSAPSLTMIGLSSSFLGYSPPSFAPPSPSNCSSPPNLDLIPNPPKDSEPKKRRGTSPVPRLVKTPPKQPPRNMTFDRLFPERDNMGWGTSSEIFLTSSGGPPKRILPRKEALLLAERPRSLSQNGVLVDLALGGNDMSVVVSPRSSASDLSVSPVSKILFGFNQILSPWTIQSGELVGCLGRRIEMVSDEVQSHHEIVGDNIFLSYVVDEQQGEAYLVIENGEMKVACLQFELLDKIPLREWEKMKSDLDTDALRNSQKIPSLSLEEGRTHSAKFSHIEEIVSYGARWPPLPDLTPVIFLTATPRFPKQLRTQIMTMSLPSPRMIDRKLVKNQSNPSKKKERPRSGFADSLLDPKERKKIEKERIKAEKKQKRLSAHSMRCVSSRTPKEKDVHPAVALKLIDDVSPVAPELRSLLEGLGVEEMKEEAKILGQRHREQRSPDTFSSFSSSSSVSFSSSSSSEEKHEPSKKTWTSLLPDDLSPEIISDCLRVSYAVSRFNAGKTEQAIDRLVHLNLMNRTPSKVAIFLDTFKSLSSSQVSDYISEHNQFQSEVLTEYMGLHSFTGLDFEMAMRRMLKKVTLPREGQRIDRVLKCFGYQYYRENKSLPCGVVFKDEKSCHSLSFALIMLNTDLHNPNVAHKMTPEQFSTNLVGYNGGSNFPTQFLQEIYDRIALEGMLQSGNQEEMHPESAKEGWLKCDETGSSKFKDRYVVILGASLIVYRKKEFPRPPPLLELSLVEVFATPLSKEEAKGRKCSFLLHNAEKKVMFSAKTQEAVFQWLSAIEMRKKPKC